ncbi:hypothetical protein [Streptomyces sp. NPDC058695]|uniref:hypothetical protein n=1 Tax=Streptomyces sp. NPDC058695 TaxID=3346604 RepID=UPI0036643877
MREPHEAVEPPHGRAQRDERRDTVNSGSPAQAPAGRTRTPADSAPANGSPYTPAPRDRHRDHPGHPAVLVRSGHRPVGLDWIGDRTPARDTVRELLVRLLGETLRVIEEFEPDCPAPARP